MISTDIQQLDMRDSKANLRAGWRMVRFGDVVRNIQLNIDPQESGLERYVAGEHMETDNLHIRQWGTIGDGYLGPAFHRKFVKGQVLYGSRRTYLRKVALAEFDGICANTTFTLEANEDELLQDLLPFIMQTETFTEHSIKQSRGSVNPYINWKDIAWYEFALPPKDEQRRIADILWAADQTYFSWLAVLDTLVEVRQIYLGNLFNEAKYQVTRHHWEVKRLNALAVVQTGLAKGKDYGNAATISCPYLRVANVQDGYLNLYEIKEIIIAAKDVNRYLLQFGDVLLTEGGDFDKLGRGTIWRGEIEGCLHQNHVFCVRPDRSKLLPEFLSLQTSSNYGKQYFLSCSKQTTNLASINSTQVKAFPVLLPTIEEQRQIVDDLYFIDTYTSKVKEHIVKITQLKRSLLCSLLTLD